MPSSVRLMNKSSFTSHIMEEHHQYVHCTGGMYVIIEDSHVPTVPNKDTNSTGKFSRLNSYGNGKDVKHSGSFGKKSSAEMRKDYIARQTSETFKTSTEPELEIGFLWSWNFMSSRRWRSANTGDEHFQDKVLSDFRAFCSNEEHRLQDFWFHYKENNF